MVLYHYIKYDTKLCLIIQSVENALSKNASNVQDYSVKKSQIDENRTERRVYAYDCQNNTTNTTKNMLEYKEKVK